MSFLRVPSVTSGRAPRGERDVFGFDLCRVLLDLGVGCRLQLALEPSLELMPLEANVTRPPLEEETVRAHDHRQLAACQREHNLRMEEANASDTTSSAHKPPPEGGATSASKVSASERVGEPPLGGGNACVA
jgi:hypothetical protein